MHDNAPSKTAARSTIWTPANIITLIRILLVPVFFVAFVSPWPTWFPEWSEAELLKPWLAALLFVVLACTDALDGYLARSRGEVTNFGKFMDPLADKILVAAALLALCELQILPAWVALVILTREFIVSGLRMLAASEGVVIAASWYGKAKTVFQIIAIVMFIIKDSHPFVADPTVETAFYIISWIFMGIALALTIISMLDYLAKCRGILHFAPSDADAASTPQPPASIADTAIEAQQKDPVSSSAVNDRAITELARKVLDGARERNATLSTAESCTGGLIAGALTAIPGSSDVVEGGIVSYSNEVKQHVLQVSASDLERQGAVSEPVALQMAKGSRQVLSTTLAVSVTGIAGPGGERPGKPVGTVWFGISSPMGDHAEVVHFSGDRGAVRTQTVEHALRLLDDELQRL